ncbi:MAG: TonB C-terminal domain-containing protein [Deltaproteobacteria bacterium]|nr:TonB C-terminal domain-containing protein [Deltaproteobacteria bacterium]
MFARTEARAAPVALGPQGLALGLCLVAAALAHLGAFLLWERLGPEFSSPEPISEDMLGLPLEITLELAAPEAAPVAAAPPVPEALPDPAPAALPQEIVIPPEAVPPDALIVPPDAVPPPSGIRPPDTMAEAAASMAPDEVSFPLGRETPLLPDGPGDAASVPGGADDSSVRLEESAPAVRSYDASVRSRVAMHWLLPPEARSNFQPGRFTASMSLAPDGSILVIMVEESSGSSSLDHAAMEALKAAAPFDPFPESMADLDQMTFRIHFDYRAVVRRSLPGQRR